MSATADSAITRHSTNPLVEQLKRDWMKVGAFFQSNDPHCAKCVFRFSYENLVGAYDAAGREYLADCVLGHCGESPLQCPALQTERIAVIEAALLDLESQTMKEL